MKIVLQPAGSFSSLEHIKESVTGSKSLKDIRQYIDEDLYKELQKFHPDGKVHIWGVMPTKYKDESQRTKNANRTKWLSIEENETFVLFAKENRCFARGLITRIDHNKKLAQELWGTDDEGYTWEYVYFFKDYELINVPVKDIVKAIGDKENTIVQNFRVLDEEKSAKVWTLLGKKASKITIAEAVLLALKDLKKSSKLDAIKKQIVNKKYYDFGASEKNIADVIRIAIDRHTDNSKRTDIRSEVLFHKYADKSYGLIEWLIQDINENDDALPDEADTSGAPEGAKKTITVNVYERDPKNRKKCIKHYGATCVVCNFNFEDFYGALGRGYIHVHHLKPLGEVGTEYHVDPIKDLRPVCPNCHAMLHRKKEAISIEELQNSLIK